MNDLLRRNEALQQTLAKYTGKAFDWTNADCRRLAWFHLQKMGRKPPKFPSYRSALSAKKALKEIGFDNLQDLLDSFLVRIPPAAMLPGDIALMQGNAMFDAIAICVGRKVIGWHDDAAELVVMVPHEIKAAWRA